MLDNFNLSLVSYSEKTKDIKYWDAPDFIGTLNYFRIWGTLICTDGIKFMADSQNCY
jgi:hypothetical protein